MKTIINRMRWLNTGVILGMFIVYLMETYSKDDKTIDLTQNWSDYKHNHQKAETNA
jgi:hypothetical protein